MMAFIALLTTSATAAPRGALDSADKPDWSKNANKAPVFKELSGDERDEAIAKVEIYLSGISSMTAKFTQGSSDGSTGSGTFYLKRPGKMRWQYDPPSPVLVVSNGKSITYYDAGLDQVTYIGMDDTLASFLTRKEIKLDNESTKLTKFEKADGLMRATVVQRKKPGDGSLTVELTDKPIKISKIITVDATGNETEVTLKDQAFGGVLDERLFIYDDKRGVNRKRNKRGT